MITDFSRASFVSASVEGPGIVSANEKLSWFSDWQKYCERNNSGRQTISAPLLAASSINSRAWARFASGSRPQRICTSAIFVIPSGVEESRCETVKVASRDVSTPLDMTGEDYFTESAGTILMFSTVTRFVGLL